MALTANPLTPGVPVALTEEWVRRVVDPKAIQSRDGVPLDNAPTATVRDGVAIIPISGPLSTKPSFWSWIFGGSNYESIARDIRQAVESPEVKAILLSCDSPGGDVSGCDELSAIIDAASRQKRVIAYVGGTCASAAYWLCSAANEIVVDACAILGSIGVRTTMVDTSKALDQMGVAVYDIVSDQSPLKVADASKEADRLRVQATLTDLASVFISRVARNRGVSTSRVKEDFGRGDVLVGSNALKAGLADRFGDFEGLLSELSGDSKMKTISPNASVKSGKCSSCNSDMDDGDDMYCSDCRSSSASSDFAPLFALTGKATAGEALAIVAAWKERADESAALKAQLEQQQKAVEAAAFDAEIATAKAAGLLAKSDEHKRNKAASAFKGKAGALEGLRSFLSALDPLSAPSAGIAAVAPKAEVVPSATGLTAEEEHVLKATGMSAEKYLAQKAVLKNPRNQAQSAAEEK
jgi:signal peptide peptidase SppA